MIRSFPEEKAGKERFMSSIPVLYLDNHLLVVFKKSGILVQADATGDPSLLDEVKALLKVRFNKPGNVFVGLVHRLDRPASGVMVLARTSKAAARLTRQFQAHRVKKIYWALVSGRPPESGHLVDRIARQGVTSRIVTGKKGKQADLMYRRLRSNQSISLVEVELKSGRHHQIRVQFASRGYPVLGDFRYGASRLFPNRSIALHARRIEFEHPVKHERMVFTAEPESFWSEHLIGN